MKKTGLLPSLLLLLLLAACGESHQQMVLQLEELERQNRAYEMFTTDSLAEQLVEYFDRHGSANERLRAHYILGCVYRDMGEAPRAIDCYLDALNQVDTTASDFDIRTLGCVYSQMGDVYHRQLLLSNEIEARQKSYPYFRLAGDTLSLLANMRLSASAYILLNNRDSAETILKRVLRLYEEYGYTQDEILSSTMLMHLYMDEPEHLSDLGRLIEKYDSACNLFDQDHQLPPIYRQFFYYKGRYMEGLDQLDSAEFYYRKIYRPQMTSIDRVPLYKGMLSVFQKRHQADSIAKYAQLYCMANDSSLSVSDKDKTSLLAASYNYHFYQKEALENAKQSYRAVLGFIILAFLFLIAILVVFYRAKKSRIKQQELQKAYESAINKRNELQKEIESLQAHEYDTLLSQMEEKIKEQSREIELFENLYKKVIVKDRLSRFENSDIVQLFHRKITFRKDNPAPTDEDWNRLITQFAQDIPSVYAIMNSGQHPLSNLQLRICILLLLDFDESIIASMLDSKPQTINTAKVRANEKIFQNIDSASLKANLRKLITH